MKWIKYWLLPLILFCVHDMHAQGWARVFNIENKNIYNPNVALSPEGVVLVAATIRSTPNDSLDKIWIFKTDAAGNIVSEKYINDNQGDLNMQKMRVLPNGNIIIVAILHGSPIANYCLILLDSNFETVWVKKSVYTSVTIPEIISTLDEGYAFLDTFKDSLGHTVAALKRTDQLGNELWQDALEEGDLGATDVVLTQSNKFVWTHNKEISPTPVDQILLERTDSLGQREWSKQIPLGSSTNMRANSIVLSPNGDYVFAGLESTDWLNDYSALCIKTNSNGELIWKKNWHTTDFPHNINEIAKMPNGGYVLLCNIAEDLGSKILLIRIDEDGNTLWQKQLGIQGYLWGYNLVTSQDGSIFICADYTEPFGENIVLIKTDSIGNIYPSALLGTVHRDPESDCLSNPNETGLARWLVKADGAQSFSTLTDSLGNFILPVDTGSYTVTVAPPGPYWEVCNSPFQVAVTEFYDTLSLDFPAQAISDCPYLAVDISAPFLRRCFDNNYYVHYCNDGTITAEDATVEVTLDPYFTYVSSTIPPASQNGNVLSFDLGDVAVGHCGSFQITAYLSCDSTIFGQTHCTSAHITPDSLCLPPSPLWDGSSIETDVSCNGDSVVFTITNVGTGGMPAPLGYIIIEDQIVLMSDEFQLGPGESTIVTVPANGSTFHLEAQQANGHPSGFASTGATIEGCGGWFSLGFFTQWAFDDDPDPFTDVDCQANVGSFDPNDKQGFPNGLGEEHLIEPGQDIEYLIRFQNTGTDTAFKVTVVDVLPPELDLVTVRPGASSHPYTYGVTPEGWLTFTFNDIMLPDSNVNEPASHGFVRFRASQRPGLGHGDYIENTALIYFDFNAPVQTNTYRHKIGQVYPWTVVGTEPPVFQQKTRVKVVPNPLTDSALLQVESIEPGPLQLVLTDVSGKLLRQQNAQGTGFEFQRGELPPGVYFFQIARNGERLASGKLMVR